MAPRSSGNVSNVILFCEYERQYHPALARNTAKAAQRIQQMTFATKPKRRCRYWRQCNYLADCFEIAGTTLLLMLCLKAKKHSKPEWTSLSWIDCDDNHRARHGQQRLGKQVNPKIASRYYEA